MDPAVSGIPAGTSRLIWVGLTYDNGAATLSISTRVLPSGVGNGSEGGVTAAAAKPDPKRGRYSRGDTPAVNGAKLAALTTPSGFKKTPEPLRLGAGIATLIPRYGPIPKPITIRLLPPTYCVEDPV